MIPKDMKGFTFHVGCKVARAIMSSQSPIIKICEVTAIKEGNIHLDNSRIPIKYPKRLLIVEQDPLFKMITQYEDKKNDSIS